MRARPRARAYMRACVHAYLRVHRVCLHKKKNVKRTRSSMPKYFSKTTLRKLRRHTLFLDTYIALCGYIVPHTFLVNFLLSPSSTRSFSFSAEILSSSAYKVNRSAQNCKGVISPIIRSARAKGPSRHFNRLPSNLSSDIR